MNDYNSTRHNRSSKARDRHDQRQRRREAMATRPEASTSRPTPTLAPPDHAVPRWAVVVGEGLQQVSRSLADAWWYLDQHTPIRRLAIGGLALFGLGVFLSVVFSPNIGPNVWALDVPLGGLTVAEAEAALNEYWRDEARIALQVGDEVVREVAPQDIGLRLNAGAMAQAARGVGLAGFPLGWGITAEISVEAGVAQNVLLELVNTVYIPPYDAGFAWEGTQLISVAGRASREMDVVLTLERLRTDPASIVRAGRLDVVTKSTPPNYADSAAYLDLAEQFLSQEFRIIGYDPFIDERKPYTTTREAITQWLAAGANGLTLREAPFISFVDALNEQLRAEAKPRYVDEREAYATVSNAISGGQPEVAVRVRYLPTVYNINQGEYGQVLSRRLGIPFGLIEEANPGTNWNLLSIGQSINLPSRDALLPETVVPNKRIVVDLDRRYMVAYENGQIAFHWRISVGRNEAPTYPGIFQILTHSDVAYGSGFSLCNDTGCNQWEMYWFMGIYEVVPGLMNGFHGAVLLPNGAYLDDGQIGNASTFGCVMASNEQAQRLFEWAEKGTVVEIISSDFPPQSEIGRQAATFIQGQIRGASPEAAPSAF